MNTGRSTSNPLTPFHPSALFPFLHPPPFITLPYPLSNSKGTRGSWHGTSPESAG